MVEDDALRYRDDLTGLHNRRYFREKLLEQKRKADQSDISGFALIMVDVDSFKAVYELYGYVTADQVISQVGNLLKQSIRSSDILCRESGDEFAVILPEAQEEGVVQVAETIREDLKAASWVDDRGKRIQPITCSLGYALYSEKGTDLNQLIRTADRALQVVKRRGGNGYCGEKELFQKFMGQPLPTTPHLVGREKELRRLKILLERVHSKGGRLVLIHGEAGVGKTRLIRELQQVLEKKGGIVLFGACHEETRSIPYYPFREAFGRFFEERKEEAFRLLKGLPEYSRWELTHILPDLGETASRELEHTQDPFRLFESFRLLLQSVSAQSRTSLLFVVEDLHLSDDASLDLLRYLARNLTEARVLICGTYRTEEAEGTALAKFADSVHKEKLSEEIALEPLSAEKVRAMLRLLCPGMNLSEELQDFLCEKTEGNPFFVEELVRYLSEEGLGEGAPRIKKVPRSIHAVLRNRIDLLPPQTKEILACGAAIGSDFEFRVLLRVQNRPEPEILDAIEAGVKAHIVREGLQVGEERYHFIHSLMADVLCSGIGKARRRLWHGQVGEALEEVYAGRLEQLNGRLTHHFELGEKWEKALDYALKSAEQAKEAYAIQEATRLYQKAGEILPKLASCAEDKKFTIAEGLGHICIITGNFEKALQEFQSVVDFTRRKGNEQKREARALARMGHVCWAQGNYQEAMKYAEKCCNISRKIDDQEELALGLDVIGQAYTRQGEYEQALECLEECLKIERNMGKSRGVAGCLNQIGNVQRRLGKLDEAMELYEESLVLREELGDKRGVATTLNNIGIVHQERGDHMKARESYEKSLRALTEIGDRHSMASALHNVGTVHHDLDDNEKALKCYEESLNLRRKTGDKWGVAHSLHAIGITRFAAGELDEALGYFEEGLKIRREIGDRKGIASALEAVGAVRREQGDWGQALELFEEFLSIGKEIGANEILAVGLLVIGHCYSRRGDYSRGLKCIEDSLRIAGEMGSKRIEANCLDKIGHLRLMTGDLGDALKCFTKSLKIRRRIAHKRDVASNLSHIGNLHQSLCNPRGAVKYHKRSLTLAERIRRKDLKAASILRLGRDHHLLGDQEKALEYLGEASEMLQEMKLGKLDPELVTALSEVWLAKGDEAKATEYCERLLKIAKEEELKGDLARAKKTKGEILLSKANLKSKVPDEEARLKMLNEAESELKEARRIAGQIGAKPLLWQILASLGRLYVEAKDSKKAKVQFREAKKVIEKISLSINDEELKTTFLNSKQVQSVLNPE